MVAHRRPFRAPRCVPLLLSTLVTLSTSLGGWQGGLQATHFWDCNGAGCDSTVLAPSSFPKKYIYAPQYAPTDPGDFGGSVYGEKLWLTGAASDSLSALMGSDAGCCGADVQGGGGCGRCLLVRNPSATNANWTAIVMKKSRCPPESKGCERPNVHFDIAVPGYDVLTESTANVCGKDSRVDTFISRGEASTCGTWYAGGAHDTIAGCNCGGLSDGTPEERMLKRGCELFSDWGWSRGDPELEFKPVECPEAWTRRVQGAFGTTGVRLTDRTRLWMWLAYGVLICALMTAIGFGVRCWEKHQEQKKLAEQRKLWKERRSDGVRSDGSDSSNSFSSSSGSE